MEVCISCASCWGGDEGLDSMTAGESKLPSLGVSARVP